MPQGFDESTNAINSHFGDLWDAGPYSDYPVTYLDIESDYPKRQEPWLRLSIKEGEGEQISVGVLGCHRFIGVITAQVFVRPGGGTALAHAVADIAADYLRAQQFQKGKSGTITTYTPKTPTRGMNISGWYQVNVAVNYKRDTRASQTDVTYLIAGGNVYLLAGGESQLLGV